MRFLGTAKTLLPIALAALLVLVGTSTSQATILFATSFSGQSINQVDTATNTVTLLENTPGNADSLIFDNSGRIVYADNQNGTVRLFDPNAHTDTLIAGGF